MTSGAPTRDDHTCGKCLQVCKSRGGLTKHQNICLKRAKGESFLKNDKYKTQIRRNCNIPKNIPKMVPMSQPLNEESFDDALSKASEIVRDNIHPHNSNTASPTMSAGHSKTVDAEANTINTITTPVHNGTTCNSTVGQQSSGEIPPISHQTAVETTTSDILPPETPQPEVQTNQFSAASTRPNEKSSCPNCTNNVKEDEDGVFCEMCENWSHRACLFMSAEEFQTLAGSSVPWYCTTCLSIRSNKIKWGKMEGEETIKGTISSIYDEIIKWRKNLFMVPRGKAGTDFIKEVSRLIRLFTTPTKWTRIAMAKVHVFIPLMLQKPSSNSKAKEHSKYLEKRLKQWSTGDLKSIMAENREIQKKLKRSQEKKTESKEKNFCKLMFLGKVSQAMKFINNEDNTRGVHSLSKEIKDLLEKKTSQGERGQ